ncbi:HAD hydrolase-like protein [Nocardioides agariphilus]|jgi:phosphoglycolate phosphatase-like HAD superfamily hydrolase|uniref:HAD hydrolase-like protein n=1 Tax=Nocardioides agariphilus TaxID=433664 RepID=A0A930YR56_9ACTN|nr:HAD hydrolase-like protein [Nocardioides agariphilus]MBF4769950.1 HAD hydrolase-like protein [Nocardioides agariphilus]
MLVVAFDLDMTLIDSAPGVAGTLKALMAELDVQIPVDDVTAHIGPPLHHLLGPYVPAAQMGGAIDRFRELYVDHAIEAVGALDGAVESIAAVRRHGGRVIVVTGKYEPNAVRHVEHLALDVDLVTGLVFGAGKADVLVREGASILVGDHVHDVEGARAAGITSVSVLTGGCSEEELVAAGTDVVLADLTVFPAWLDAHLDTSDYPLAPVGA